MSVTVIHGDCLVELPNLATDTFHAAVCDPPYHLTSIVKRFGGKNAAPAQFGSDGVYARASAGFMGKQWDGGDIALRAETWTEVLRVLKPGAHLLAFGGTRTFHRMAVAIEDAGFEIRDTVMWLYGSGFPKSHNVSKGIDKRRFGSDQAAHFKIALTEAVRQSGKTRQQINAECGFTMRFDIAFEKDPEGWGCSLPTVEQYDTICRVLCCAGDGERLSVLRQWPRTQLEKLYKVVGYENRTNSPSGIVSTGRSGVPVTRELTEPGTPEAAAWAGWGTALKPAWEPIIVARKPMIGTVAANVLAYGTGALNIDACRVGTEGGTKGCDAGPSNGISGDGLNGSFGQPVPGLGRWPANVIHDGSDEVEAAFPDAPGQQGYVGPEHGNRPSLNVYGDFGPRPPSVPRGDAGSAARFFYSSKADASDRASSKHPTVKPLDLMRYLVRLVTPPNGHVLDCFAGSGSTGEAAKLEGFDATLIEREAEYIEDIRRRLGRASGDDTPLFAGVP